MSLRKKLSLGRGCHAGVLPLGRTKHLREVEEIHESQPSRAVAQVSYLCVPIFKLVVNIANVMTGLLQKK